MRNKRKRGRKWAKNVWHKKVDFFSEKAAVDLCDSGRKGGRGASGDSEGARLSRCAKDKYSLVFVKMIFAVP